MFYSVAPEQHGLVPQTTKMGCLYDSKHVTGSCCALKPNTQAAGPTPGPLPAGSLTSITLPSYTPCFRQCVRDLPPHSTSTSVSSMKHTATRLRCSATSSRTAAAELVAAISVVSSSSHRGSSCSSHTVGRLLLSARPESGGSGAGQWPCAGAEAHRGPVAARGWSSCCG